MDKGVLNNLNNLETIIMERVVLMVFGIYLMFDKFLALSEK